MKLATVSLGCAPLLTQYLMRSKFSFTLLSFCRGLYVPISSMNLPSRGLRPSATTIRNTGEFFAPMRFIRILTGINYLLCRNPTTVSHQQNSGSFPKLGAQRLDGPRLPCKHSFSPILLGDNLPKPGICFRS